MSAVLLIIAAILFIIVLVLHMIIRSSDPIDQPLYIHDPILGSIPWICGLILPVIPFSIVLPIHWLLIFFLNIIFIWIAGAWLAKGFLVRFASGKGLGNDMLFAFIAGAIALIIGLVLR